MGKVEEEIYDCTDLDEYRKYEKIMFEKYKEHTLNDLKKHSIIVQSKIDRMTSNDTFAIVPVMISLVGMFIPDLIVNSVLYSMLIKAVFVIGMYTYIIFIWGRGHRKTRNEILMATIEHAVIENIINTSKRIKVKISRDNCVEVIIIKKTPCHYI